MPLSWGSVCQESRASGAAARCPLPSETRTGGLQAPNTPRSCLVRALGRDWGADGGSRTHMSLRPQDFKSRASAISPRRPECAPTASIIRLSIGMSARCYTLPTGSRARGTTTRGIYLSLLRPDLAPAPYLGQAGGPWPTRRPVVCKFAYIDSAAVPRRHQRESGVVVVE